MADRGYAKNEVRETQTQRKMTASRFFGQGVVVDRNIVRLFMAATISSLQMATILYGNILTPANVAASAAYIGWALWGLFAPRYGAARFLMPAWVAPTVELAVCGAIIATGGPVLVTFLAAAVAIFMPSDYLRHISRWSAIKAFLIAAFVCAALMIAHRFIPDLAQARGNPMDEILAALIFSFFAAALGGKSINDAVPWNDELSHHVAFASKAPAERLLELIHEGVNGSALLVFRPASDRPIVARFIDKETGEGIEIDQETLDFLWNPLDENRAFLFNTLTGQTLQSDHRDRVGLRRLPLFAQAWNKLFHSGKGAAIPIVMGRLRGWLYFATEQDLSYRSFLELRRMSQEINSLILRFERFDSWRERTLAEARLLASRDMHDSVLQTLAGLRMQLSSMVKTSEAGPTDTLNAQMKSLDAIVAAEQQHLRTILNHSREDAETAAELFSYLEARTLSLTRQWHIRCTVQTPDESLPVSEETAIECEFMLREAISNAAQHADAEHIHASMRLEDNTLLMTLKTEGYPSASGRKRANERMPAESRSLRQRVAKLGGAVYLEIVSGGSLLSIQIPLERK